MARKVIKLLAKFLGVSRQATSCEKRGFAEGSPAIARRIEQIGAAFVDGFELALDVSTVKHLAHRLLSMPTCTQGFAFEGATMALALVDYIDCRRVSNVKSLLGASSYRFTYTTHVGLGWALARAPFPSLMRAEYGDPLIACLRWDGLGFHEAYFHHPDMGYLERRRARLRGLKQNIFMQGVGRSLWFICGGIPKAIGTKVTEFPKQFEGDLWSGAGLAALYAGGGTPAIAAQLREESGEFKGELVQGAAFAAKALCRSGCASAADEVTCQALCGMSIREAAQITDEALPALSTKETALFDYQHWRLRIQRRVAESALIPSA
jgi:enediyne biosynthesis protein E3